MIGFRHLAFIGLWLAAMPARADVITYIRFEEGSGLYAADETGLMNGTLLGSWATLDAGGGDSGFEGWSTSVASPVVPNTGEANTGSLRFGGGGYVNLSNPNHLDLGTAFTIEFYFLAEPSVSGGLLYGFEPVNQLYGQFAISDGTNLYWGTQFQDSIQVIPATNVVLNQWQHYALVKEPGEYSIYVDGNLEFNGTLPPGTDGPYFFFGTDVSGDRTIGGESGTWYGYIDEFRISDEALTPDQFLIVPEPSTLVLISLGILGVCGRRFAGRRIAGR